MVERRTLLTGIFAAGAVTLLGCSRDEQTPTGTPATSRTPAPTTSGEPTSVEPAVAGTVATGLNVPWAMAFLASGAALVSQRDEGTIVRIDTDGTTTTLGEVAGVVGGGEGGLLGLALAPGDETTLFAYVTTSSDNRVVRLRIDGDSIGAPDPILAGIPLGPRHHGGRLLFAADGTLFVATGDAGQADLAQDRDSLAGKILRIDTDGAASDGNPFDNRTWSYGHRNVQGLAFDASGALWATEFGDKTADELNLIERGGNYGWPQVEGESDESGLIDPKVTWGTDECSPAGLAIARSTAFLGALQGECLFAVPLEDTEAGEPKAYFAGEHGRIRSVDVAPDGALWVTTSNTDGRGDAADDDDRVLRVTL